jgi:phosphoribosylformylglycinamidine synthase
MAKLPVGDPTLSDKEIIGNESQERMGLIIHEKDLPLLQRIAERERAPLYVVGRTTGDHILSFINKQGEQPMHLELAYLFGKPPKTILDDKTEPTHYAEPQYDTEKVHQYLDQVLQMEAVACKDWLTNKVDRSVTGRVAKQQCAGTVQLPLNNLGVVAIDYQGVQGIATSIGHAPVAALAEPGKGSQLAVAEALTNLVWAPVVEGLKGVSLSANWMWPAKNPGEDARLYEAVKQISDFAISLGINIPTGKDSLSMTQKYPDGQRVYAPGTVIISTVGEVENIRQIVEPVLQPEEGSIIYIDFSGDAFHLGGSSFAQSVNAIGSQVPGVPDPGYFVKVFETIQQLIREGLILAGHDISAGGMITTLLEMIFGRNDTGMELDLGGIGEKDIVKLLFSEKPGVIIQVKEREQVVKMLDNVGIKSYVIGKSLNNRSFQIINKPKT